MARSATYEYNEETRQFGNPTDIHRGNKQNGIYEEWDEYGGYTVTPYKDGKPDGVSERRHPDGTLRERIHWKNGDFDGTHEEWDSTWYSDKYDNGKRHYVLEHYTNGVLNGTSEERTLDGVLIQQHNYKDGKLVGPQRSWYPNGQEHERSEFKNGVRDGFQQTWHPNGAPHTFVEFRDGHPVGVWEAWYDNGQIRTRNSYDEEGNRHGVSEAWDAYGGFLFRHYYDRGTEVSEEDYYKYVAPEAERGGTQFSVGKKKGVPKSIGIGENGDIYDWTGRDPIDAFRFLIKRRTGDLRNVFRRSEIGQIDLIWGDDKGGLCHIVNKHIGGNGEYKDIDDMVRHIADVINNGEIVEKRRDTIAISHNGYRVVISDNYRGKEKNWIVTSYEANVSESKKRTAANPSFRSHGARGSETAAPRNSDTKVETNSEPTSTNEQNGTENAENGTETPVQFSVGRKKAREEAVSRKADELAERYGAEVTRAKGADGKKGKGWQSKANVTGRYDPRTGKTTITVREGATPRDVERTVFTTAVAGKGLSNTFGDKYADFIDNVFVNADESTRREMLQNMRGTDYTKSVEDWLADYVTSGAFDPTDPFWREVKKAFQDMLDGGGFDELTRPAGYGEQGGMDDGDLRYVLWHNTATGGGIVDLANDNVMQQRFKVNDYRTDNPNGAVAPAGKNTTPAQRLYDAREALKGLNADNLAERSRAWRALNNTLKDVRTAMLSQQSYDVNTIRLLVDNIRLMIERGILEDLHKGEVKNLLSLVKNGMDTTMRGSERSFRDSVDKLYKLMIDNQWWNAREMFQAVLRDRVDKTNKYGVAVIDNLDATGGKIIKQMRDMASGKLGEEDAAALMCRAQERMADADPVVAKSAEMEYAAAAIMHDYITDVRQRERAETSMREEAAQVTKPMTHKQSLAYLEAMEENIRQSKLDRANALLNITERLNNLREASAERAKEWKDAKAEHAKEVLRDAKEDMAGRGAKEYRRPDRRSRLSNNPIVRMLFSGMNTANEFFKILGNKSPDGEGFLYHRFIDGWADAATKEYTGHLQAMDMLNAETERLFGKGTTFADVQSIGRGGKGETDVYDAVRLTDTDRKNFPRWIGSAAATVCDTLAELLTGCDVDDGGVTLSLRMADAWGANLVEAVRETLTQYFIHYVLARWFELASPDAAQAHADGATAQLDLAASLLWKRRRPGRPKRHIKEEE
ncbi:MAG: hypothetical protein LUC22_01955 [Prevotella sp.]|nr:hypothetical protein [Prevotella sp.]